MQSIESRFSVAELHGVVLEVVGDEISAIGQSNVVNKLVLNIILDPIIREGRSLNSYVSFAFKIEYVPSKEDGIKFSRISQMILQQLSALFESCDKMKGLEVAEHIMIRLTASAHFVQALPIVKSANVRVG